MRLLDRVSYALHEEAGHHPITKAFYVMSMSLLGEHSEETLARGTKTADYDHHRYQRLFDRKTNSCQDLRRDPKENKCLGMCGPKCWCWSIVCDDCCFHQGCYEHDCCCRKNKLSGYCLFPFFYDFSCGSFGGYPDCLYELCSVRALSRIRDLRKVHVTPVSFWREKSGSRYYLTLGFSCCCLKRNLKKNM